MENIQLAPELNLCWILDITGSMSGEIYACKAAIKLTAQKVQDAGLPVQFSLITFWDDQESIVNYYKFTTLEEATKILDPIVVEGG